ncbi:hypothetical protein AVEN_182024-1 [Araneus ventricosus]|uniref:Uncharacterized protein n=1 Tax=Araneus ventricosus TaxID=182803 RepID=A0A4Y2WSI0_ARAVE|nr:hypothetical protein AVEN_182024-1 [Araneus ventricosus]
MQRYKFIHFQQVNELGIDRFLRCFTETALKCNGPIVLPIFPASTKKIFPHSKTRSKRLRILVKKEAPLEVMEYVVRNSVRVIAANFNLQLKNAAKSRSA